MQYEERQAGMLKDIARLCYCFQQVIEFERRNIVLRMKPFNATSFFTWASHSRDWKFRTGGFLDDPKWIITALLVWSFEYVFNVDRSIDVKTDFGSDMADSLSWQRSVEVELGHCLSGGFLLWSFWGERHENVSAALCFLCLCSYVFFPLCICLTYILFYWSQMKGMHIHIW